MLRSLLRFARDTRAQTSTEYGLLVFLCALGFIGLGGINGPMVKAVRIFADQILFVISLPFP